MDLEHNLKISLLLEIYGKLLTNKQQEILNEFFNCNISLSEIAQSHSSSRQAVNDLIKRSVKILEGYEDKLGLLARFNKIKSKINKVLVSDKKDISSLENALNNILEDL